MNRPRPKVCVTDIQSSLPPEEPIAAYRSGDYSPGSRKSRPSRRWFYDPPSGSFGSSSLRGGGGGLSSTQEDWALARFIYQWTIHCCYCWSFCVLATAISLWHLSIRRLGYQPTFRLMVSENPLGSSYYRANGRDT